MSHSLAIKYVDNEVSIDICYGEVKLGKFIADFSIISADNVKSFIFDIDERKNSSLEFNNTNGHCSIQFYEGSLRFNVCDSGNVFCSLNFQIPYNETMGIEFRKLVEMMEN